MFYNFLHPFTMVIAGPSMSGKTTFIKQLLANKQRMFNVHFDKVIWCYSEPTSKPNITDITFHHGIMENFENKNHVPTLIILDDLMNKAHSSSISDLFTKGSHHKNLSIILVTHNIYHQSPHSRNISLNTKYLVLFKNPRDKQQFSYLSRQICPENSRELLRVYNEVLRSPHAYFIIDLTQGCHEFLRFRTDIFNSNYLAICFANLAESDDVELETIEGEQTHVIRA